jgi:hypothetical protein
MGEFFLTPFTKDNARLESEQEDHLRIDEQKILYPGYLKFHYFSGNPSERFLLIGLTIGTSSECTGLYHF